jgi:hypothetical protein
MTVTQTFENGRRNPCRSPAHEDMPCGGIMRLNAPNLNLGLGNLTCLQSRTATMRALKSTTASQRTFEGSRPVSALTRASGYERYVPSTVGGMRDEAIVVFAAARPPQPNFAAAPARGLSGLELALCGARLGNFLPVRRRPALSVV